MPNVSRRDFVSILGSGAVGLSILPLTTFYAQSALASTGYSVGFGPLVAKLPRNSADLPAAYRDVAILALPREFEYSIVSVTGETMSDGNLVPGAHDGMAAFRAANTSDIILVRNHELNTGAGVIVGDGSAYDRLRAGGTTNLVFSPEGRLKSHYGSLAGTERNCAGGPTPWSTWLTCEETFSVGEKRHGYVFEVPTEGYAEPEPIIEMGRFNHEAAAVDPVTSFVYLTEDRSDSLVYRFRPNVRNDMRSGGVLEALRLLDFPGGVNTSNGFLAAKFRPFKVDWVTIDVVDPDTETSGNSTRAQGQVKGAATFSRGEGAWYGNGLIYVCCSNGGNDRGGQIWAYHPRYNTITLVVEAQRDLTNPALADNGGFLLAAPDNITVGPNGVLYLCEDGSGVEKVVGVNQNGLLFEVARNVFNDSEFAGACFAARSDLMFVNLQSPGFTCVIQGPWHLAR